MWKIVRVSKVSVIIITSRQNLVTKLVVILSYKLTYYLFIEGEF